MLVSAVVELVLQTAWRWPKTVCTRRRSLAMEVLCSYTRLQQTLPALLHEEATIIERRTTRYSSDLAALFFLFLSRFVKKCVVKWRLIFLYQKSFTGDQTWWELFENVKGVWFFETLCRPMYCKSGRCVTAYSSYL